jgi:hypothetical protein
MDSNPIHSFEISVKKVGLMGIFGGKPMMSLHEKGISWPEGSTKKFVEYTKISQLKYSKYYTTVSIIHTGFGSQETKKLTVLNIAGFETTWKDFAAKKGINIVLKAE